MVLLVFAGSAAEFALNRAVDWLFFTGKLPGDPIGRLFATASYAQQIVFADELTASCTLDRIRAVHQAIEQQRGESIPDWAHRDVLYMLIDYSERAHELLARPLSADEQSELYDVFYRVGIGLRIPGLPASYTGWRADRESHLRRDLVYSDGTAALYARYRDHLGRWRYHLLLRIQAMLAPEHVRDLLRLRSAEWLRPLLGLYRLLVRAGLRSIVHRLLMPSMYLSAVRGLDRRAPGSRVVGAVPPRRASRRSTLRRTHGAADPSPEGQQAKVIDHIRYCDQHGADQKRRLQYKPDQNQPRQDDQDERIGHRERVRELPHGERVECLKAETHCDRPTSREQGTASE